MNLWVLIALITVVTFAIKAVGPVALGGRDLPPWFSKLVVSMAPALLAALVITTTLADGQELEVGANTVGVGAAGVVFWRGGSVILGVVVAAAVTAGLRAL